MNFTGFRAAIRDVQKAEEILSDTSARSGRIVRQRKYNDAQRLLKSQSRGGSIRPSSAPALGRNGAAVAVFHDPDHPDLTRSVHEVVDSPSKRRNVGGWV